MTVEEVLDEVESNLVFHDRSGGGMTLSGGEPLAQSKFLLSLLQEASRRRINTSMETCGYASWDSLCEAASLLNSIIFDIKILDSERHQKWTGTDNRIILENFNRLCREFPALPKYVRTPVIPGFNDNAEDIRQIAAFVSEKPVIQYELLGYHKFGTSKYSNLDRPYLLGDKILDNKVLDELRSAASDVLLRI